MLAIHSGSCHAPKLPWTDLQKRQKRRPRSGLDIILLGHAFVLSLDQAASAQTVDRQKPGAYTAHRHAKLL
eukprot:1231768-Pyramimonas_sp.AAC.2